MERARGFIAALATDADNVFLILSVKTLNPDLTVVTRASEEDAEEKLRRAGADIVFSPFSMAGHGLAQALLRPHVAQLLDPGRQARGTECDDGATSSPARVEARFAPLGRSGAPRRGRDRARGQKARRQDDLRRKCWYRMAMF